MTERTLATRFRSLRTDRLWLDDVEVFSVLEYHLSSPSVFEFVFERSRPELAEVLVVHCDAPFRVTRTSPPDIETGHDPVHEVTLVAQPDGVAELQFDIDEPAMVRVWNAWLVDEARHGWIGNHGLVVDELEVPDGASRRQRLWASDGFGDPTFDDLVCVLTIADSPSAASDGEE